MDINPREVQKASKRERNRADYLARRSTQDAVLLRLDKGDAAILDSACRAAGLSRAAFARLYLVPLCGVLAARAPQIDQARIYRRQSLKTYLAAALDSAAQPTEMVGPEPSPAANEFDALFGSAED